jgi:hypothetical protein
VWHARGVQRARLLPEAMGSSSRFLHAWGDALRVWTVSILLGRRVCAVERLDFKNLCSRCCGVFVSCEAFSEGLRCGMENECLRQQPWLINVLKVGLITWLLARNRRILTIDPLPIGGSTPLNTVITLVEQVTYGVPPVLPSDSPAVTECVTWFEHKTPRFRPYHVLLLYQALIL